MSAVSMSSMGINTINEWRGEKPRSNLRVAGSEALFLGTTIGGVIEGALGTVGSIIVANPVSTGIARFIACCQARSFKSERIKTTRAYREHRVVKKFCGSVADEGFRNAGISFVSLGTNLVSNNLCSKTARVLGVEKRSPGVISFVVVEIPNVVAETAAKIICPKPLTDESDSDQSSNHSNSPVSLSSRHITTINEWRQQKPHSIPRLVKSEALFLGIVVEGILEGSFGVAASAVTANPASKVIAHLVACGQAKSFKSERVKTTCAYREYRQVIELCGGMGDEGFRNAGISFVSLGTNLVSNNLCSNTANMLGVDKKGEGYIPAVVNAVGLTALSIYTLGATGIVSHAAQVPFSTEVPLSYLANRGLTVILDGSLNRI